MPNKLVYVGFGFLHHLGGHAGYHQIKEYLDYDYIVDCQSWHNKTEETYSSTLIGRIRCRVRHNKYISKLYGGFNRFPWFLLKCIFLALTNKNLTFHFIYGENLYRDISILHLNGCKVVCTFHQPYEWFASKPQWMKRLKSLDHIILVGKAEIQLFEKATGKNNVTFIPHGVCSDFYCPDTTVNKERMVLTVGNWLRDFTFANNVYQQLLLSDSEVKIVIVSNPCNKQFIIPNERISFLTGITDEELRNLYRRTSCLFLPLTRYTANNALLEAASVGCPILLACNEPDNSYIPEDCINLCPMDEAISLKKIISILNSTSTYTELSEYVDSKFGWLQIASLTKHLLKIITVPYN